MEEESWRRNHGGGIMEEESSRRHPGGHLGGIWGASGRHLGDIWGASGRLKDPRRLQEVLNTKSEAPLS